MFRRSAWALAAAGVLLACGGDSGSPSASDGREDAEAGWASLELTGAEAEAGELVVLRVVPDRADLSGVQGHVRFDTSRLAYVGQVLEGEALVLVNNDSARAGDIWFLGYRHEGLPARAVSFVLRARRPGFVEGLGLSIDEAVREPVRPVRLRERPGVEVMEGALQASGARPLTLEDWVRHLRLEEPAPRLGIQLSPGDATRYGDPSLNGVVSALDAALTANVALGQVPLLSDPARDFVIASNVQPFNLPGLGEASDPLPPGQNADGSRSVTVLDVSAIKNETLGLDQPIVGELVPGRVPAGPRALLSGTVDSGVTRVLTGDTIYELPGAYTVGRRGTLVIRPGTRIEATAPGAVLVVQRSGRIEAQGTRLLPIVMTCAAPQSPGCWRGVQLHGFGILNNGRTIDENGDVYPCPEKQGPAGSGAYGGCLPNDGSGFLRYARIEYAGASPAPGLPGAGLQVLANGAQTGIDHVQVHASLGDGLLIAGGNADLRNIVITRTSGNPLHWLDGWNGRMQFLLVQQDFAGSADLVLGESYELDPGRTPVSAPIVFNATLIGSGAGGERGLVLEDGSLAVLRNLVILRTGGTALDINGSASCAGAAAGTLVFSNSIVFQATPPFATDPDCIDEDDFANAPALGNRVADPVLLAPFQTSAPDWRPEPAGPASSGAATVPVDGFLDPSVTYIGAVPLAAGSRNVIPWHSGWTRGWSGAP